VCPAGQYNDQEGNYECYDCPIGTYQPNNASVKCISCVDGTYSLTRGSNSSNSCINCELGYICLSGFKYPCGFGYYCPYKSMIHGIPCKKGNYCPKDNCTSMVPCPKGTYNNDEGTMKCKDCDVNFICPRTGMEEPEACPLIMQRSAHETLCHFGEAFYVIAAIGVLQVIVIVTVVIVVVARRLKKNEKDESKLIPTPKGGPSYEGL